MFDIFYWSHILYLHKLHIHFNKIRYYNITYFFADCYTVPTVVSCVFDDDWNKKCVSLMCTFKDIVKSSKITVLNI